MRPSAGEKLDAQEVLHLSHRLREHATIMQKVDNGELPRLESEEHGRAFHSRLERLQIDIRKLEAKFAPAGSRTQDDGRWLLQLLRHAENKKARTRQCPPDAACGAHAPPGCRGVDFLTRSCYSVPTSGKNGAAQYCAAHRPPAGAVI